jgi:hypothetical protein
MIGTHTQMNVRAIAFAGDAASVPAYYNGNATTASQSTL